MKKIDPQADKLKIKTNKQKLKQAIIIQITFYIFSIFINNIINKYWNYRKYKDPTLPEIVLFGLILVNFFPPTKFPTKYPPVSEKNKSAV